MSGTLKVTTLQDGASATANLTLDSSGNTTAGGTIAMSSSFKRNRIINGNMVIDQRNAGASVTQTTSVLYTVDRWSCYGSVASKFTVQQNAGSVTPPAGHTKYLGITSSSAYTVGASEFFFIQQVIEGYNIADFGWGAAGAQTVTASFWVRSSLTGTFGGTISNGATTRVYPFTYTISAANTWEQKTVTIAGDTSGTWTSDNTGGVVVNFNMGAGATVSGTAGAWSGSTLRAPTGATSIVGTSGATWYVTGVQLEVGTVSTPYERQIYNDQLAQCQRYCYVTNGLSIGRTYSATNISFAPILPVPLRSTPTASATGTLAIVIPGTGTYTQSSANAGIDGTYGSLGFLVDLGNFAGLSVGAVAYLYTSKFVILSAEL